jgi:hypothetical protein
VAALAARCRDTGFAIVRWRDNARIAIAAERSHRMLRARRADSRSTAAPLV